MTDPQTQVPDHSVDLRSGTVPDWFLRAIRSTVNLGSGLPGPATEEQIDELRDLLACGGRVVLIREGCGAPAAAGWTSDGPTPVRIVAALPEWRDTALPALAEDALSAGD